MPLYSYKCEKCEKVFDEYRQVGKRGAPAKCICGFDAPRAMFEEGCNSTDTLYHTPVLSDSLGCNPGQINEMRRRFPHHEYMPDGRLIIRSHNQYKKIRKELGYHDRAGYS